MDPHVSLQVRLQYFDTCVGPTILFGMAVFQMTRGQLEDINKLHKHVLRRIIEWRFIDGEDWKDAMKRMKLRLERSQYLYYYQPWSN